MIKQLDKRIKFVTGSIELNDLMSRGLRAKFGKHGIEESLWEIFQCSDCHIWESWHDSEVTEAAQEVEIPAQANREHYLDALKEDVRRAMGIAYRDSLATDYYEALKEHMQGAIDELEGLGMVATFTNYYGKPCEFNEADSIKWAMSKKAYFEAIELDGFTQEYHAAYATENTEHLISDLDIFKGNDRTDGDSSKWKELFNEYSESVWQVEKDIKARLDRVKELIKNRVPLNKRESILKNEFKGLVSC